MYTIINGRLVRQGFFKQPELPVTYYEQPDPAGGGGGGGSVVPPPVPPAPKSEEEKPPKIDPATIVAKYAGDATRMAIEIDKIQGENFNHRTRIRDLDRDVKDRDAELTRVRATLPKDGQVVLNADEYARYQAYQALGPVEVLTTKPTDGSVILPKEDAELLVKYRNAGSLEELERLTVEYPQLTQKVQVMERRTYLGGIAEEPAPGVRLSLPVFEDLDNRIPGLNYEQRDVLNPVTKKTEKKAYVLYKDDQGRDQAEELLTFAESNPKWKPFYPALVISTVAKEEDNPNLLPPAGGGSGPEFPEQPQGGPLAAQLPAEQVVNNRYGHNIPTRK